MLKNYKINVNLLRKSAQNLNLADNEINKIFEDCLCTLEINEKNVKSKHTKSLLSIFIKIVFILIACLILLFIIANHHQPTLSLVLRNVQSFIYPGFKILRLLTIPILKVFPSLSELYDEICLIENPYFEVSNMDCWPCQNVHSVINLTDSNNFNLYQSGVPYVLKNLNKSVFLEDIQELYISNAEIFKSDARRLTSNNPSFTNVEHLMNLNTSITSAHILWRTNRMAPARIIRKLFPKPAIVSAWSGQSMERFVLIDGAKASGYILPNPECSYVLLTQGSGERMILLKPTKECSDSCRPISVVLRNSYSLWYNWWYWKPVSLPTPNSANISISYVTSYC